MQREPLSRWTSMMRGDEVQAFDHFEQQKLGDTRTIALAGYLHRALTKMEVPSGATREEVNDLLVIGASLPLLSDEDQEAMREVATSEEPGERLPIAEVHLTDGERALARDLLGRGIPLLAKLRSAAVNELRNAELEAEAARRRYEEVRKTVSEEDRADADMQIVMEHLRQDALTDASMLSLAHKAVRTLREDVGEEWVAGELGAERADNYRDVMLLAEALPEMAQDAYLPNGDVDESVKVHLSGPDRRACKALLGHAFTILDELSKATRTGQSVPERFIDLANAIKDGRIAAVKFRELWLYGPNGVVDFYAASSGEIILDKADTEGMEVYCPLGFARFMNNGTFHGAGMFDLLFSQHRALERLQKQLYQNIFDIDRYGVLVLPQGEFNQDQVMREVGKGLKVLFWQPDPMAEGFNPFSIAPFNTGDMPGRLAAFAREGLTKVNPIRDLIAEKGRVDSANGLQFLDEQVNKSLSHPVTGVGQAWGNMYRSLAQKLTQRLLVSPRAIPVTHLTLDLAGAVIDQKTGMVSFETNPIPSLSRLAFTLKSLNPRSELARKAEALDLWEKGLFQQDGVMGFKLLALSEGLDFALYLDKDRAPYEQCIRTILTLFNDGESPGQVIITPHTCRPDLLLELMTPFMQGPHLANASPDVVDAFIDLHSTLLTFLQPVLPPGVPNPDDQALLSSLHSPTPGQSPLRLTGA